MRCACRGRCRTRTPWRGWSSAAARPWSIGDPARDKTPALFEALGRAVERLGGRYWAAEDVGVSPSDLALRPQADPLRRRASRAIRLHRAIPSPVTAEGVKRGIALCVERALGRPLNGVTVAIQGVGHVGAILADKLAADGAQLIVCDVNEAQAAAVAARTGAAGGRDRRDLRRDVRCLRPLRARRGDLSQDAAAAEGQDRGRRRQQPAGRQGDRPGPFRRRPHLCAGLRGQRRRHHQRGRRRSARWTPGPPTTRPGWR